MTHMPLTAVWAAIRVITAAKATSFTSSTSFIRMFNLTPARPVAAPEEIEDGSYHRYATSSISYRAESIFRAARPSRK